jgi:polar amino acid transport system substrate-binding protein
MVKKLAAVCFGGVFAVILSTPAWAGTALERIERTGTLRVGTRADTMPFSYVDENGEQVGYSIDLLALIHQQLEQELSRNIELNLVEVNVADRFTKVENQEVDLVCSATTYTSARARRVDFSVGFFRTGTQFLVKRSTNLEMGQFRVGVIAGTTNAEVVQRYLRVAKFVQVKDRADGLDALNTKRIDALVSDGILLEGLRHTTNNPEAYDIIPPDPIQPETYACILPKNNPDFLQIVNHSLLGFMQGVVENNSQDVALMDKWFGENGVVPINQEPLRAFFQRMVSFYSASLNGTSANETPPNGLP